jgi:hypothetical protein
VPGTMRGHSGDAIEMIQQIIDNNFNYTKLLEELLKISNKFSFVIRSDDILTEAETSILNLFEKYLLYETEVEAWPGTELFYGGKARIFYYSFTKETFDLLIKTSNSLYEWLHPEKPEDLCFYNNETPVFASISHEHDSYFIEGTLG